MSKVKIIKSAPSRRGILQRGVLAYRDILDQPKAKYVVSVDPSPVQSMLFFADSVSTNEDYVILELAGADKPVAVFHKAIPWYAVAAAYVDIVTTEDVAKYTAADHASMHKFEEILAPISGECSNKTDPGDVIQQAAAKTGLYL